MQDRMDTRNLGKRGAQADYCSHLRTTLRRCTLLTISKMKVPDRSINTDSDKKRYDILAREYQGTMMQALFRIDSR